MLTPPLTFYVDESGTPDFRRELPATEGPAYVTTAVAIPSSLEGSVLNAVIRDAAGRPIKATDMRVSDDELDAVLSRLLEMPLGVGMVVVDRTGRSSISTAKWVAARMSSDPRHRSRRAIREPVASYVHLVMDAIINCWGNSESVLGWRPSFIDVVIDQFSLPRGLGQRMREALIGSALKNGLRIRNVTWESEEAEPLLAVPDFLAGLLRRGIGFGDYPKALATLRQAHDSERVMIQDGKRFQS